MITYKGSHNHPPEVKTVEKASQFSVPFFPSFGIAPWSFDRKESQDARGSFSFEAFQSSFETQATKSTASYPQPPSDVPLLETRPSYASSKPIQAALSKTTPSNWEADLLPSLADHLDFSAKRNSFSFFGNAIRENSDNRSETQTFQGELEKKSSLLSDNFPSDTEPAFLTLCDRHFSKSSLFSKERMPLSVFQKIWSYIKASR